MTIKNPNNSFASRDRQTEKMASFELDGIKAPPLVDAPDIKNGAVIIEAANEENGTSAHEGPNGVKTEDWVYPHPTDFKLSERPIDDITPLRVRPFCYTSLPTG
jgi:hypothetical protein